MTEEKTPEEKTEPSTALALNSDETLAELQKEVEDEFITSDKEVYKEALRSLKVTEQKLKKQINEIHGELKDLEKAKQALDHAFKNGELHSVEDARGVTRTVASKIVDNQFI
jgi:uncharacterized protein with PIN domain